MKTYEITEEQIKELAKINAETETQKAIEKALKEWYPQAFETKLEVGKWYKSDYPLLIYVQEVQYHKLVGYGFNQVNEYLHTTYFCTRADEKNQVEYDKFNFRLATDSEVLESLKNEFKKQNPNVIVERFIYNKIQNIMGVILENGLTKQCFNNGIWYKFYTKEEAEKLLNAKIV